MCVVIDIVYVCIRPPPMTPEHLHYHNKESKYAQVLHPNLTVISQ